MNPVRNIPFGQMGTLECAQVLLAGKMPNGIVFQKEIRKESLSKIVEILKANFGKYINLFPEEKLLISQCDEFLLTSKPS